jgi:transglutaminase-like putative cysteine protease
MGAKRLDRGILLSTIIMVSLAVAPHVTHVNPWISAFYFVLAGLRLLALWRPRVLPGRFVLLLLTAAGLANVIAHHRLLIGRNAGVALLVSMLGLKLLESRGPRDLFVSVFLGYFLIVTQFLYSQSIGLAAYLAVIVVGLTAILVELSKARPSANPLWPLRRAGALLAQAVPLMLVLFVLFPRLSGPLWNLDMDSSSGVTGLTDRLSVGSVSNLSQSRAVAFRVEFGSHVPDYIQRYWRGPVFWTTDGKNWSAAAEPVGSKNPMSPGFSASGDEIAYTVTLEPTGQRWIFALDLPSRTPVWSSLTPDFQLLAATPVNQEIRYRATSYPEYNTGALSEDDRHRALQLPDNISPRMTALVKHWQGSDARATAVVGQALDYFRSKPFVYTLQPPVLGDNPTDEFLFETRRGFCEHYATSFTLLMRLAGIPTRVVAGYQGGEHNPHGDYYIVRQSDAHAWSEVWLQNRGWVRVDPTSAVAPERIERPFGVQDSGPGAPISFELRDPGIIRDLFRQAGFATDALNMAWRRWVLDYDNERQGYLLELLGLDFVRDYALGVTAVLISGFMLLLVAAGLWGKTHTKADPVERQYRRFCHRLARRGLRRRSYEGPRDFADRVVGNHPDLKPAVKQIVELYISLRYGPPTDRYRRNIQTLRNRISRFRP